jgi:D-3-phosphoglycerate dehydrogenase
MRILANDGLSEAGKAALEESGFEVLTTRVAQPQLAAFIQKEGISALLVRSATQVTRELIDACPGLKLLGRIGSGTDNIDVAHARIKGLHVVNTPGAGADSVAELVFAHLLGGARFLHESNRIMPLEGDQRFKALKKAYSGGTEVRGKTLGIVGMGYIGRAVARLGLAFGMEVVYHDPHLAHVVVPVSFQGGNQTFELSLSSTGFESLLSISDFVSLHIPAQPGLVIGARELGLMKPGAALINTARGGLVDEPALLEALESGHLRFAALDVFETEPTPEIQVLMHPGLSLSPHIGGSTPEAQERASLALAQQVIELLGPRQVGI